MKSTIWIAALGLLAFVSSASATVMTDTYHGANGHGYGDVISDPGVNTYDVDSMHASLSGNLLTVTIGTKFAGHGGVTSQWTRDGTGIGYGDLFLSSGWNPYGSSSYDADNAANGNHWTYAFSLDNPLDNSGGTGTVYALGAGNAHTNNPDALLSDDFMDCSGRCVYRNGQEVAVNKKLAAKTSNTGSWFVGNDFLRFSFDTAGLNLDPHTFGFHWTMYCGNDVIEGLDPLVDVPEPGPAGLFVLGLGIIGLGVMRKRKTAR